jgi:hypothetical protein
MPRYVIHIGPHKTGTTYLQAAFLSLRETLAAHGICYPLDLRAATAPGHHGLAQRLLAGDDAKLAAEFAELNASDCKTILLSSETLQLLDASGIARLRALVGTNPATIVFYVRQWTEVMVSGWQGSILRGETVPLVERLHRQQADPLGSRIVNPGVVLDAYAAQFGKENIKIANYNLLVRRKIDLLDHFFASFLDLKEIPAIDRSRKNASMGPVDTEILRSLNIICLHQGSKRPPIRGDEYLKVRDTLDLAVVRSAMDQLVTPVRFGAAAPIYAEIRERIVDSYRHCFVKPSPRDALYGGSLSEPKYVREGYLYDPGVYDAMLGAYRAVRG